MHKYKRVSFVCLFVLLWRQAFAILFRLALYFKLSNSCSSLLGTEITDVYRHTQLFLLLLKLHGLRNAAPKTIPKWLSDYFLSETFQEYISENQLK